MRLVRPLFVVSLLQQVLQRGLARRLASGQPGEGPPLQGTAQHLGADHAQHNHAVDVAGPGPGVQDLEDRGAGAGGVLHGQGGLGDRGVGRVDLAVVRGGFALALGGDQHVAGVIDQVAVFIDPGADAADRAFGVKQALLAASLDHRHGDLVALEVGRVLLLQAEVAVLHHFREGVAEGGQPVGEKLHDRLAFMLADRAQLAQGVEVVVVAPVGAQGLHRAAIPDLAPGAWRPLWWGSGALRLLVAVGFFLARRLGLRLGLALRLGVLVRLGRDGWGLDLGRQAVDRPQGCDVAGCGVGQPVVVALGGKVCFGHQARASPDGGRQVKVTSRPGLASSRTSSMPFPATMQLFWSSISPRGTSEPWPWKVKVMTRSQLMPAPNVHVLGRRW